MSAFEVFGRVVPIYRKKMADGEAGEYDPNTKEITIEEALEGDELVHTEIHELLHATWDRLGFEQTKVSEELEEVIVQNFATVIVENYRLERR